MTDLSVIVKTKVKTPDYVFDYRNNLFCSFANTTLIAHVGCVKMLHKRNTELRNVIADKFLMTDPVQGVS